MNSAALKSCLERENALVVEFLHALEAETEALMDRRAHESLQAAVQRKETLADDLAQLGAERDALLSGAGLASGPAGTDAAAAAHPELGPLWQQLHQGRGRQPRGRLARARPQQAGQGLA
ncbi:flagellar protein FlgN, partial [Bordetella pertussis]|uniref:flagellar protein FlgN n=1 Tax=Bordetella pertussis TaxID=520 RepID=UPI0021CBE69B